MRMHSHALREHQPGRQLTLYGLSVERSGWRPIDQQPIGWDPDIDDGVPLNVRRFMADAIAGGGRGAGILRSKPNNRWRKGRDWEPERDAERFPWFWAGSQFTGARVDYR